MVRMYGLWYGCTDYGTDVRTWVRKYKIILTELSPATLNTFSSAAVLVPACSSRPQPPPPGRPAPPPPGPPPYPGAEDQVHCSVDRSAYRTRSNCRVSIIPSNNNSGRILIFSEFFNLIPTKSKNSVKFRRKSVVRNFAGHSINCYKKKYLFLNFNRIRFCAKKLFLSNSE